MPQSVTFLTADTCLTADPGVVILKFCPEHNINTTCIRRINLQPFSNKHLFGEHTESRVVLDRDD